jgi:ssDNA-binding Zn-finger/Zn-ribbon topoisomerase 1
MIEHELKCPDCGGEMWLKTDNGDFGPRYLCERFPICRGAHGADAETGAPLGIPANAETRAARSDRRAHRESRCISLA